MRGRNHAAPFRIAVRRLCARALRDGRHEEAVRHKRPPQDCNASQQAVPGRRAFPAIPTHALDEGPEIGVGGHVRPYRLEMSALAIHRLAILPLLPAIRSSNEITYLDWRLATDASPAWRSEAWWPYFDRRQVGYTPPNPPNGQAISLRFLSAWRPWAARRWRRSDIAGHP